MAISSHKELEVWKRAMQFVKEVYETSKALPKNEQFGLVSQMQRSAVSIPSNIAEGYTRKGRKEYVQFLWITKGSSAELETQLLIASDVHKDIDTKRALGLLEEVQKMLTVLLSRLNPGP